MGYKNSRTFLHLRKYKKLIKASLAEYVSTASLFKCNSLSIIVKPVVSDALGDIPRRGFMHTSKALHSDLAAI